MSMAIDTDLIDGVLIGDHWYVVEPQTFDIDAYEFVTYPASGGEPRVELAGGQDALVPAAGFSFMTQDGRGDGDGLYTIMGPLTAIQALRSVT